MTAEIELGGTWRAADVGEGTPELADYEWTLIEVPSHWVSQPGFATAKGPIMFRREFALENTDHARSWLTFDGVFTHGSLWFDDAYSGEIDGYFAPHSFEVTNALHERSDHVIALEVTAPSFNAPWSAPGGIWGPVHIKQTGTICIRRLRALCGEATSDRAQITFFAELDSVRPTVAHVRSTIAGADHELTQALAHGANRLQWTLVVEDPELWWPWELGAQPMFDALVEVTDNSHPEEVSDSMTRRVGLRHVAFDRGITTINSERLFLKGIEAGNDGTPPIHSDRPFFQDLIGKTKTAGGNLLVRNGWVEPAAFFDVADELGMLVWQGAPVWQERGPQPRHAREVVETLGHHPSIALWLRPSKRLRDRRPAPDALRRAFDRADPSRPNVEHPESWDLNHLSPLDVFHVVPDWVRRTKFVYFTSDPREASTHIDALRRLKYEPIGGFMAPLALRELLHGACDPVRVLTTPSGKLRAGSEMTVHLDVVNDLRTPITKGVLTVTVSWKNGEPLVWEFGGDSKDDAVTRIGSITFPVPETVAKINIVCDLRAGRVHAKRSLTISADT